MKILILSADFSVPPFGGISSHISGLAPALRDLGHEVHILVPSNTPGEQGVRQEKIGGVPVTFLRWGFRGRIIRWLRTVIASRRYLRDLIRTEGIEVIDVQDLLTGPPIARGVRRLLPVVFTNHTSVFTRLSQRWWGRMLLRTLIGRPTAVVGGSPLLMERSVILGNMPRTSIPCGIDVDLFPAAPLPATGEHVDTLLFVGRFHPVKGLEVLLKAMAEVIRQHPSVRLRIAGGGTPEQEEAIAGEITRLGIGDHVELLGRIDRDRLPALYAKADIVVLPSFMEGTSLTLLEAMACARPIVATAVGGTPAVIRDGETGLLVPPGDPAALAAAIGTVLSDPARAHSLGAAAREAAERDYAWPVIAARVADFYRAAIERFRER